MGIFMWSMTPKIKYKKGYKYQLVEQYEVYINILPEKDIYSYYVHLFSDGLLRITKGYAWDGASGPAIDTKTIMRGSLVHDALYQLMREGLLDQGYRRRADKELIRICREDGMSRLRAWWVFRAVDSFASSAASEKHRKKILIAP